MCGICKKCGACFSNLKMHRRKKNECITEFIDIEDYICDCGEKFHTLID